MSNETPVLEKKKQTSRRVKEPSKYKVVIHNDDVTPVDFVIVMLMTVFNYDDNRAVDLTMAVHTQGKAVAGVYPYEIAEQKAIEATGLATSNAYPLVIKVEAE